MACIYVYCILCYCDNKINEIAKFIGKEGDIIFEKTGYKFWGTEGSDKTSF